MLLLLAVPINVHDLLQDDALFNFGLANEFTVDVRLKLYKLLSTLCRFFISTSLGFRLDSCLLLSFCFKGSLVTLLIEMSNCVCVLLCLTCDVVSLHILRMLLKLIQLF